MVKGNQRKSKAVCPDKLIVTNKLKKEYLKKDDGHLIKSIKSVVDDHISKKAKIKTQLNSFCLKSTLPNVFHSSAIILSVNLKLKSLI